MSPRAEYVRRLLDETRDEITHADTKASIVLAGAGIAVGILLTGLVTGDVSLEGERWYVGALAWLAGVILLSGVALVGSAVYPRVGAPQPGRARWFEEIAQYGEDEDALDRAIDNDISDRRRDLHQTRVLAGYVHTKYKRTQVAMWLLGGGFGVAGLAALLGL